MGEKITLTSLINHLEETCLVVAKNSKEEKLIDPNDFFYIFDAELIREIYIQNSKIIHLKYNNGCFWQLEML